VTAAAVWLDGKEYKDNLEDTDDKIGSKDIALLDPSRLKSNHLSRKECSSL